ncbi:signal peptidase I [Buchnera aphidicola]|uniref:signal peptidase I n=1 Tax=Buchnera aphidicola TaxID=9 RepID=UPI001559E94D|nr:signal peptidase I [Buchnera aphidicola]
MLKDLFLIIFIISIRLFIFQSFTVSSSSMNPSLLTGDYILVQKFFYNIKNLIKKIKFNNYQPKRNDIIIFQYPKNTRLNYIKRVIGLPGDMVFYNPFTKRIYIFKKINNKYTITYNKKEKINNFTLNIIKNNKNFNNKYFHTYRSLIQEKYQEKFKYHIHDIILFHGIKNSLYLYNKHKTKWMWIIPKNQYFVMGDNRDKSSDSRLCGLVKKKNILGKAKYIWFSINYKSKKWLNIIRFHRIFKKIQ